MMKSPPEVLWPAGPLSYRLARVITDFELVPATVHELTIAEQLLIELSGWALGDRN